MNIRPAEPGDAAAIAAIWNAEIRDGISTFNSQEKSLAEVEALIDKRRGACLVAEEAGAVLGFATYDQFRGGIGYARTMEHTVYLSADARGKGVGRTLMATLEQGAREAGVHSLIAGVGGENAAGVAFHEALGYREVGRLPEVGFKFGRSMDLVLLQKIL